jgi:hypothetical protein
MNPVIIDVIGTIKGLVKWALKEVLLLLGILMFGLSAPLLFTLGAEILVWQDPTDISWGVAYFFLGPFACAIWMVFICHWHSIRQWQLLGRLHTWREDHGGMMGTVGKSIWFMVAGFFGSALTEAVFFVAGMRIYPHGLETRESAMLYFAIAPLFVFAPVLLVLLSRYIRRDECATA